MKKIILVLIAVFCSITTHANQTISSPDGRLIVNISDTNGQVYYTVCYDNREWLAPSLLGLKTDIGDFSKGLALKTVRASKIDKTYTLSRSKMSSVHYEANELQLDYVNADGKFITITFCVSDNDIAYRYSLYAPDEKSKTEHRSAVIMNEVSSFNLVNGTTTFLCPQIGGQTGWMRTKPSYEEEYKSNEPMAVRSRYGLGYTFPCLFKTPDGWALLSETGVGGNYCAAHLSDYIAGQGYTIAYPDMKENNGQGSAFATIALPGNTPWRTITIGTTLKPIVETTIPFDVVEPLYEASEEYKPGRYTWSWLIWQDNSANYNDQIQFVNLAAAMGYEYVLVDALWDVQMGRQRMAELSKYAQSKGVSLMLWYNSNGFANDAPQSPKHCMNTSIGRDKEMAWMQSIGVKGIKVDFFGGDKQETMRLYEDILYDANRYGIQVIFHGCTLPRGWERMYPNYVSSEAVLASENVYFSDYHAKREAQQLTMHPFCRNTVGSMDWGGTILNKYLSKDNKKRHRRQTSDVFEIAAAIVNQASVQCIAIYPNNLMELPQRELDLLKEIPTIWDETQFIDGYPMKYVVIARRHGNQWWIAGLNAEKEPKKLTLDLPMLAGKVLHYYTDKPVKGKDFPEMKYSTLKVNNQGKVVVNIQPNGGILLCEQTREISRADMLRVYEEVKTPYKYGVVIEAPKQDDMVDCPSVFRVNDKWMMTYVLFDGRGYETWLAESEDLLHWQTKGKVLEFADKGWDKEQRGGFPALQDMDWGGSYQLNKYDGKYWMSYIGSSTTGYEGLPINVGLASTEYDPSMCHQWQTYNHPIMAWNDSDVGQWESHSPYKSIIYQVKNQLDSKFMMFYNAAQQVACGDVREKIGIATSNDLRHWKRYDGNPIFQHDYKRTITGDAQIQRMGDLWVMFYYCAHNPERSKYGAYNSFAVSRDLIHWTDWTGTPLVAPSEDYDARYAHKSFVVKWNDTVYHFYCAVDQNRHRTIALATSKDIGR